MKERLKQIAETVMEIGDLQEDKLRHKAEVLWAEAAKQLEKLDVTEKLDVHSEPKTWSGADRIYIGPAPDRITPGCLVLEGGSFRGCYTSGVLDVLMENGINLQTTIGTSAGALNGYNYVAGEIGRAAAINLRYRHDSRYIGLGSAAKSRGLIGFHFLLEEVEQELPFDQARFDREDRRFLVTATDVDTGEVHYLEKGVCSDMRKAVQASASMPLAAEPVEVDGLQYLDGGCVVKVPYQWALDEGFEKILVVRTRPQWFRRGEESRAFTELVQRFYGSRPQLVQRLLSQQETYNTECDELDTLAAQGRVLMLCPSGPIEVGTLEGDMEKLGALYLLGRKDTECRLPEIRKYLGIV